MQTLFDTLYTAGNKSVQYNAIRYDTARYIHLPYYINEINQEGSKSFSRSISQQANQHIS